MTDTKMITCPCTCHGSGLDTPCSVAGGCGHLHASADAPAGTCRVCPRNHGRPRRTHGGRHICTSCLDRIHDQLTDIGSATFTVAKTHGSVARRGPGFAPSSPAADDVIAALDLRSLPHDDVIVDDHGRAHPDGEINSFARSILGSIVGINDDIAENGGPRRVLAGRTNLGHELAELRTALPWCAARPGIRELAADVAELHRYVRRLAHREQLHLIGACPALVNGTTCRTPLYAEPSAEEITCPNRACRAEWPRRGWLFLGQVLAA